MDSPYFTFMADATPLESFELAGGRAVVASQAMPGKTTPNEDSAAIIPLPGRRAVLIVADGLGGHASGEIASRTAIEEVSRSIHQRVEETEEELDGEAIRAAIISGIENANQAIIELANGAATTLCVAEIEDSMFRAYHIGDSVLMVVGQRGKVKFQTLAHSPVGYAVEAGLMNEAEAMRHEERHLISNVLGSEEMRIDIGPMREIAAKDTILLASDGLVDNLLTEEIIERCRKGAIKKGVERLMHDAHQRMEQGPIGPHPSKPDDLTVLVFRR